MMWAATVRRCPTGPSRHPSQFGARLQLARALNHAPYLICDGSYDLPSTNHTYRTSETRDRLRDDYLIVPYEQSDSRLTSNSLRGIYNSEDRLRNVLSCYRSRAAITHNNGVENSYRRNSLGANFAQSLSPVHTREVSTGSDGDVRVELPYSRREFRSEDYLPGDHFIRRYENMDSNQMDSRDDDNVVSLSYQQQSIGGSTIYDQEIWGNDLFMDCWDNRRFLIEKGVFREAVKFLCVMTLSLTLIFFVIIGFGFHNILVTVLFLVLLLSTVLMAIFLLMRRPVCSSCTEEPVEIPGHTSLPGHRRCPSYISDVSGVKKKKLVDSPPPYEFPPDYASLPPELLVSAISLQEMTSLPDNVSQRSTNKENSSAAARRFLCRSSRETIPKEPIGTHNSTVSSVPSLSQDHKLSGESSAPNISVFIDNPDKLSNTDYDKSPPTYERVIKVTIKDNMSPSKTKTDYS